MRGRGDAQPTPPSRLLGFGGGLKMIVPGLAAEQTIAQNHKPSKL